MRVLIWATNSGGWGGWREGEGGGRLQGGGWGVMREGKRERGTRHYMLRYTERSPHPPKGWEAEEGGGRQRGVGGEGRCGWKRQEEEEDDKE